MARRVEAADEYATSVVRLFSGWAESPIWFSGPVAYPDTRLHDHLVSDLRAWDTSYYTALTSDGSWADPDDSARYHRAGAQLARRLAEQIGDDFQVEHDLGETRRRVRAPGPPLNAEAAAAFHAMAHRALEEHAQMRDAVARAHANGDVLHWSTNP